MGKLKLFWIILAAGLILGSSNLTYAAETDLSVYNQFRNTKTVAFNGDLATNCRVKISKSRERVGTWERDVIYEICLKNNKLIYVKESYDGGTKDNPEKIVRLIFSYKAGKLVRVDNSITYESVGFRNGQPIAVADFDGVNSDLNPDLKKLSLSYIGSLKDILHKFGIR
jgi:hypothetical protein